MRQLQRVLWSKGVLLNPQHLQLQDRYLEELLEFRLDALTFRPWGFARLEPDREALTGGVLALHEAAGLLPDGLVFDIPGADAAPEPLPLAEHWRPDQNELLVYLGIAEHRVGGRNITTGNGGGGDARYMAEVVLRRDENTGLAEKPIQVARRNLRLLAAGESLEGTVALPVARVRRGAAGELELDPAFVPPLVDIAASPALMTMARRLVELLAAKSSTLAGMRRERNVGLADFGTSDVANFWLLYTVNSHLPRFRHLFETRRGHPEALYAAMLELAGSLMTFGDGHPRDLPAYDHGDLGACFTALDARLRELLDTAVPTNHVALPLRRTEPSVYATALDQDRYFTAPAMYLAMSANVKKEELPRRVPQLLKVSSADQIERLIRHGLPGVALSHVAVPPGAVPLKLNYQYFALERTGPDWDAIRMSRHLAVHVPAELPDPEIELIILLPGE